MNKTHLPIDVMKDRLYAIATQSGIWEITNEVLDNKNFCWWAGSVVENAHHQYEGGLLEHTYEVVMLSRLNADFSSQYPINFNHLFLAALYHDIGKLWDYEPVPDGRGINSIKWIKTTHCRNIHHITRSGLEWERAATKYNFTRFDKDEVLHAILSHHGRREWGSPVAPRSRVAWLVHLADQISARMNDADTLDIVGHKKGE